MKWSLYIAILQAWELSQPWFKANVFNLQGKGLMPTSARDLAGERHEQSLESLPTSQVTNPKFGIRWKQTGSFSLPQSPRPGPELRQAVVFKETLFFGKILPAFSRTFPEDRTHLLPLV